MFIPGDEAWLTVPSRDSGGYSKRDIGQLTIRVRVVAVARGGRSAEVVPVGGSGSARVAVDRLARVDVPVG